MRRMHDPLAELLSQLESCKIEDLEIVNRDGGLQISDLIDAIRNPIDYTVDVIDVVDPNEIIAPTSDLEELGRGSLAEGHVACVMYVKNVDDVERLIQDASIKRIWFVVEDSKQEEAVVRLLKSRGRNDIDVIRGFNTFILTPHNRLCTSPSGPEFHPCGEGDVLYAFLKHVGQSNLIEMGVKHIMKIDGRGPRLACIGAHLAYGSPVTCEVTNDPSQNGPLLYQHSGFNQLIERFKLSHKIEIPSSKWMGTGSMIVRADLDFDAVDMPWHRIKHRIGDQLVVSYKRFISDLTSLFQTRFISSTR